MTMPQATDELRKRWGTDGGAGDEKAIEHLVKYGFEFNKGVIKPPPQWNWDDPRIKAADTWGAIEFLCDEWDYSYQPDVYYRYEHINYASSVSEYGDAIGGTSYAKVYLIEIPVHHHTKHGVVLDLWSGTRRRFVNKNTQKQYAHPTKKAALEAYIERRRSEAAIYHARANHAEVLYEVGKRMLEHGFDRMYTYQLGMRLK